MTEPAPGAGSDPSMLQTSAVPDGNAYRITGKKWFITGADGAAFTIVMARMLDGSASMFLADMKQPGIELERQMDSLDSCFTGGHGVLSFENLRVPATDVLGEIGQGFRYAQVRLAPARLTHCMRWLGQARRAHDVAVRYATQRRSFGKSLVEHEGVGFMLADNEMDLYAARLAIWHTAWVLDQSLADPGLGGHESSVTKVMVSEATWRIVDRAVQVLGGQGVTAETIVARIFRDLRAFRIYDGPSEVHRWSIAKHIAKRANDAP
jgi:acyl-CoA dehydrogenase